MKKLFIVVAFLLVLTFVVSAVRVLAVDITPTPIPDTSGLENQIRQYESKISDLQGQEKTLSSQIAIMDNQVKLTEARIADAKVKIANIEKDIDIAKDKVGSLEQTIATSTKALLGRISATYQVGSSSPWEIFLTSGSIENFFTRLKYLRIVQAYDKKTIYAAEQAKVDYSNQKSIYEDKQAEAEALSKKLQNYTNQLEQEKKGKQSLLSDTQGSESNYQRLLAAAKAQLAGFSSFAANQGGASLLSGQTSCDDWGCYYNQRDSQWGALALNNTQYTIASDGCLITSMAMMLSHYGHRGVTPISINSNSDNFASYYPAYLKYTISVDGVTAQRIGSIIDSTLGSGHPVIVGIRYSSGDTHFVVLKSGSGGNYVMNDPFVPNGKNINFTDHYSVASIFEVDKVVIN